jgi:hypothetical protein
MSRSVSQVRSPANSEAAKGSGPLISPPNLRSPAERLDGEQYHTEWLQNLLVSASLGGYRRAPQKAG